MSLVNDRVRNMAVVNLEVSLHKLGIVSQNGVLVFTGEFDIIMGTDQFYEDMKYYWEIT